LISTCHFFFLLKAPALLIFFMAAPIFFFPFPSPFAPFLGFFPSPPSFATSSCISMAVPSSGNFSASASPSTFASPSFPVPNSLLPCKLSHASSTFRISLLSFTTFIAASRSS